MYCYTEPISEEKFSSEAGDKRSPTPESSSGRGRGARPPAIIQQG